MFKLDSVLKSVFFKASLAFLLTVIQTISIYFIDKQILAFELIALYMINYIFIRLSD